jgi:hypothetical protein
VASRPGPGAGVAGATLHGDHPLLARWQLAAARWSSPAHWHPAEGAHSVWQKSESTRASAESSSIITVPSNRPLRSRWPWLVSLLYQQRTGQTMDGDSKPTGRSLRMGRGGEDEEGGESARTPLSFHPHEPGLSEAALGAHSVVKTRAWLPTADPSGRFRSLRRDY